MAIRGTRCNLKKRPMIMGAQWVLMGTSFSLYERVGVTEGI